MYSARLPRNTSSGSSIPRRSTTPSAMPASAPFNTIALPPVQLYTLDSTIVLRELIEATIYARDLLASSAVRADGGVLERPLPHQHQHRRHPQGATRIATSIRPHALGSFCELLVGSAAQPGDADLPEQRAEHAHRAEPELRPRTDGASHARRRRRLHAAGRHRGGALLHRLALQRQHRRCPRRHVLLRRQPARQQRQDWCSAYTIAPAAGINDGINVLQILAEHPSTARFVSRKLLRWLLDYDPSPALVADVAGEFTRSGGNIKAIVRRILQYENVLLGAAALQAAVSLHRVGAARPRRERDQPRYDAQHLPQRDGPRAVRLGAAERVSAVVRVLGRAAAAALELRLQPRQQQRQRRDVQPDALLAGATTAVQIADRIEARLFTGDMPAADKAALIAYLRPDPPSTVADPRRVRSGARIARISVALER